MVLLRTYSSFRDYSRTFLIVIKKIKKTYLILQRLSYPYISYIRQHFLSIDLRNPAVRHHWPDFQTVQYSCTHYNNIYIRYYSLPNKKNKNILPLVSFCSFSTYFFLRLLSCVRYSILILNLLNEYVLLSLDETVEVYRIASYKISIC